nr:hypothetical protein CFP56_08836 [Quercus suber]
MVEREKSKKKVKLCHHQTTVPSTGIVSVFRTEGSLFQMGISSGAAEAAAIKLHLDAKLEIYCQSQSLRGNL